MSNRAAQRAAQLSLWILASAAVDEDDVPGFRRTGVYSDSPTLCSKPIPRFAYYFFVALYSPSNGAFWAFNDNEQTAAFAVLWLLPSEKKTYSRSKLYPPGKGQSAYSMYEVHARKAYPYVMVFRSQTSTRRTLTSRYDMCRICIVHIQPRKHC